MHFKRSPENSSEQVQPTLESLTLQGSDEILIAGQGLLHLSETTLGASFRRRNAYSRAARQLGDKLLREWVYVRTRPREERSTAEYVLTDDEAAMSEEGIRAYVEAGTRDTAPQHLEEMKRAVDMCEQLNETIVITR